MSLHNTLAVVSQSGCSVSFFDLASGERVLHVPDLTTQPHELAYDHKTKRLFISHTYEWGFYNKHGDYGNKISVFDVEQKAVTHVIDISPYHGPHGLHLSPDGKTLFSSVEDGFDGGSGHGGVIGIDIRTEDYRIVKTAASTARSHWLVVTDGGKKVYTTNKELEFISVLDLDAGELTKKIPFPGSEEGDSSPDGRFVYYPFPTLNLQMTMPVGQYGFKVIDTKTDEVVRTVLTELPVMSIKCTSNGNIVVGQFASKTDAATKQLIPLNGKVTVFNPDSFEPQGDVEVGLFPLTMLAGVDGETIYVANMAAGTVDVIDLEKLKVLKNLLVDNGAGKVRNAPIYQGAHGMALIV